MQVSSKAIRLISHFEGRANYAYNDPVGVCTVGVGHALTPHRRCTEADYDRYGRRDNPRMSDEHVDRILRRDLKRFEEGVTQLVRKSTLQREFDAMVCLAFNIGIGGFKGSTVLRMHNARRSYLAGLAFMRWVFGGGVVLPGLVRRRRSERYLYRKGGLRWFL
jgi:lysozyme